ncbi:MAG TPA: formate--phosphoribosylaminoimidazolecarboxamide ligase family protein [Thermoplasmata archaeon]|nr:formate--phosphoribosylaminoimidazolecarboxamide ligase family protein [Thermoplasmata archaeon]
MSIARAEAQEWVQGYGTRVAIGCVGSHSALDISDGAVAEGFRTVVLAMAGRDRTYSHYFRAVRDPQGAAKRGCVDETWAFPKFADAFAPDGQARLRAGRVLLVPNRALSSYVPIPDIEENLRIPMVGSRHMLRIEERSERENYYSLLTRAGIRSPERVDSPQQIDSLTMVKLPHAVRRLERGFFTAASPKEYDSKAAALERAGTVTRADLAAARIERYVVGPVFNFNFFHSPLAAAGEGLELLGVDERRESSLDGLVRLPAAEQLEMGEAGRSPRYTVVGHGTLTVRESILEEVFQLGEKFVAAARERYPPGIIGPFCLQTCIDPEGTPWVFDVAVRIGGGTNIHLGLGHPYGNALWREPMSTGRRIAREVRHAIELGRLTEIVT